MSIFDKQGKMRMPKPASHIPFREERAILSDCRCHNGHSLLSKRVLFQGHPGIFLRAELGSKQGYIALSPFINDKSRVCIDLDIEEGAECMLACPECEENLPVFAPCPCGGKIIAMKAANPGEFIGVCNVAGCPNALIIPNEELLQSAGLMG